MRMSLALSALLLSGCAAVSSVPHGPEQHGVPYLLPKGLVPIQVFADEKGIGLTIEPSQFVPDSESGSLIARLSPSPFNNEDMKFVVDRSTGFLTSVTSNSDAQLLAIAEEGAKSAARLALQNSRAAFLAEKVVVFDDSFDPLRQQDIERINIGIDAAIHRAADAFINATNQPLTTKPLKISVVQVNGAALPQSSKAIDLSACAVGICTRIQTTLLIRVELDNHPYASKIITIPSREVTAVPIPTTILSDQDITLGIKDGMVEKYDLKRDSGLLTIAKFPGAVVGGVVSGLTQNLTDKKSIADKRKDLAESEEALAKAQEAKNKAVESSGETSVPLQNATDLSTNGSYAASALTVYPFSETLTQAVRARIEAVKRNQSSNAPNPTPKDGDLTE